MQDSGEGIAEADIPHIFERFRTNPGSCARGTGLGLALVQAIAAGHGGEVRVQSEIGSGSRFELVLPTLGLHGATTHGHGLHPGTAPGRALPGGTQRGSERPAPRTAGLAREIVEREAW